MAKKSITSALAVSAKAIDPALDALFASSSGPLKKPHPPSASRKTTNDKKASPQVESQNTSNSDESRDTSDNTSDSDEPQSNSDIDESQNTSSDNDNDSSASPVSPHDTPVQPTLQNKSQQTRARKRKRSDENQDLEAKYMAALERDTSPGRAVKRHKDDDDDEQDSSTHGVESDDQAPPLHESLVPDSNASDMDRASRTVFLGNVSIEAISFKQAKKTLISHLTSVLNPDETPPPKLESLRFRSVAFSAASMPKRAAYITKSLMESTTRSANAYAVFSTPAAARKVASQLNGTMVLGRHLRADCVAHPSPTDHRRCVFVGNLGFVDDETVVNTDGDGQTVEKKKNKVPSDVEEGLWRVFGKKGKVESVRVVRDAKTRVGKGIAYVQFYDANHVEGALLLDGTKHPPMLPRRLRVTRAKDPRKTALAQSRAKEKAAASATAPSTGNTKYRPKPSSQHLADAGRASKLLGRAGAFKQRHIASFSSLRTAVSPTKKSPEQIVFEGKRASAKDGRPSDLKLGKQRGKSAKPNNKGTRRAAEWRKKQAK